MDQNQLGFRYPYLLENEARIIPNNNYIGKNHVMLPTMETKTSLGARMEISALLEGLVLVLVFTLVAGDSADDSAFALVVAASEVVSSLSVEFLDILGLHAIASPHPATKHVPDPNTCMSKLM